MSLVVKRKEHELAAVTLAKQGLELKIMERLEEIERLKQHIKVQEETEERLNDEIKKLKEG